ncbi:TPA: hypothetical protein QFP78_000693 [Enterococcus faecium]|nr:hypothetical protein [Enterococcus faecium]
MNTPIVNKRAIDSEELFQIINNAEGIYQSTLEKMLFCNRISLASRLDTLKRQKWIQQERFHKQFVYTNNFDLKNLKTLDAQANIIQKLHIFNIYVDKITVFTNSKKQKELFLSAHSSGRTCFKTITRLKQQAHQLINQLPYESAESDFFVECVKNELTKFPILASSMTEESKNSYYTASLDTIEILTVPTIEFLPFLKSKLDDFSYRNIERNTHYIREDILVYIEQIDKLIYFKKNEHREYEFNQIISIMDFYYFLAKYSHSKDSVYFSLSKDEFDNAHTLYRKSEENKQKFNTVQIKKDKQKAQS